MTEVARSGGPGRTPVVVLGVDPESVSRWARDGLVRLLEITSFSGEEHAIVEHLKELCGSLDLPVHRFPVEGAADDLLIAWTPHPMLLLTAHVDTIRPTWDWEGRGTVRHGVAFGLGAQDDKGSVVAALLSLLIARGGGVPLERLPVGVGPRVDEEVGGRGSAVMAKEIRPRFVVGLEGADMHFGLAEAGCVEVWFRVTGCAVPGALREKGVNAIERGMHLVAETQTEAFAAYVHPLTGRNIPMIWELPHDLGAPRGTEPQRRSGICGGPSRRPGLSR